ncbi:MAG: branched-chain amino acid ABC transporter permease [Alphaproteobacteria bacterium]
MKKLEKFFPLIPVYLIYGSLFLFGNYTKGMWQAVALCAFYAALGQAFNVFLGMTGYVDFGYVAFMALGAYGMALTISNLYSVAWLADWLVPIGLVAAAVFSGALSIAVGAIALRLRGAYFAIATVGVNEGFRFLLEGIKLWGGSEGIVISSNLRDAFGSEGASQVSTFWADVFVFLIAALAAFLTLQYMHSRIGYALAALRADEDAAKVIGVNTTKYKIIAFITSSALGGLVGATAWTLKLTYVFPAEAFAIHYTVEAIVIVILGGAGTLMGPVAGGILYAALKYGLGITFPGLQLLILAPIIIAIIVIVPEGLIGVLKSKVRGTTLEKFIV